MTVIDKEREIYLKLVSALGDLATIQRLMVECGYGDQIQAALREARDQVQCVIRMQEF